MTFKFIPNGLLGSGRPPPTESPETVQPLRFTPSGLLGGSGCSKTDSDSQSEREVMQVQNTSSILTTEDNVVGPVDKVKFVPKGLLSNTLNSLTTEDMAPMPRKEPAFVPNDLLSNDTDSESNMPGPSSRLSFVPNGLLSKTHPPPTQASVSSQGDEDFPPPFKAFGVPSTLLIDPLTFISTTNSAYSIRATTFDGRVMQFKRKSKVVRTARKALESTSSTRMGNLLDVPIHRLLDQLSLSKASELQERDRAAGDPQQSTGPVEDTLWVDRYRPQKYTDLMGNERIARETITWVKQWDWCVFGSKKGRKRPRSGDENYNETDEYHRPQQKILLLSGPPGLGKTTLAHVIARQAGYEVMEINASDARSGSIVDDRIRPALESGSAIGSTKPVLLIIDEIDGATGAGDNSNTFIHKLVSLTFDKPRNRKRQKDLQAQRPILRPIICICNDLNASSLAKLKPHALQIRFQRPADIHTVRRLREVCEIEGLKADSRALSTLVGVAKGDLRGCLNTLQFIKSRYEEVTENVVRKATVGMKEADASLNTVLNNLFNPLTKKRVKELALTEEEEGRYVARLSREIDGSGRESSIALGQ
ncbi:hypothetical protein H0H81_011276 [Sphagnurus paluster]|uniref:AAA+ ATPase domain-containing protein n=1 Tax=Sphagnurus paluster TaxID=117069 RepID=A0A9P7KID0_9AGAR|nr:hypothetical protein H0H81_011276 [Sphagnurus paluster]